MRYSYEVYLRERPKRQAQRKAQKEQKLKEKINKLNGSKKLLLFLWRKNNGKLYSIYGDIPPKFTFTAMGIKLLSKP